jgi:hypothetical protein
MNHYAEGKADLEDRLIQLKLRQTKIDLYLELQSDTDERLSNIEDLNALLEPTDETFRSLKRWEIVHQIDPDYPYPEAEIKEQDWIGINKFLYGETNEGGAKAKMIYDENMNIDSDVYNFIRTGNTSSDDPVVKEAEKRMEE